VEVVENPARDASFWRTRALPQSDTPASDSGSGCRAAVKTNPAVDSDAVPSGPAKPQPSRPAQFVLVKAQPASSDSDSRRPPAETKMLQWGMKIQESAEALLHNQKRTRTPYLALAQCWIAAAPKCRKSCRSPTFR